ncbi:MAG: enolase C-terminal domain-like protein [Woeseiaceae bacterium]
MAPDASCELLASFSGESAERFEPFFQFSNENRIVQFEVHAVGTHSTTARYSASDQDWKEVNNILRLTTADGYEGISGVGSSDHGRFNDQLLSELNDVAGELAAVESLDPVEIGRRLQQSSPALSDAVRASVDIALWDLAARKADCRLCEMLGAERNEIDAYASLPFYDSLAEHLDAVEECAKLGFKTFKFHAWGSIEADMKLVESVKRVYAGSGYRFMLDLEGAYGPTEALRLGELMGDDLFDWLEGPLEDECLDQYADLRDRLAVELIPAGYQHYSREFIRQGIEKEAWDAARFDVVTVGGISTALDLLIIANDAELPVEIQSWGHSLTQAANLHVTLANSRSRFFEAPMPKDAYEFGMANGNLLNRGSAAVQDESGLGLRVDWDSLAGADYYAYSALDL